MAVPEQTPYKEYVGNGVTTNFALGFTCDLKQELKVFINDIEPELSTWSLTGGSVSFTTAPALGSKIAFKRATKLERTTNYLSSNNSFRPEAINKDLDRIWYAIQEQNFKAGQYDYDYNFVLRQVRPVNTGGTGADNPNDARNNLNIYSKEEVNALIATGGESNVVGVSGGGTGATTAAGARTNLDVMSSTEVATAISNATSIATEIVAGKAKIATTAIAQAGVNDTDFLTPLKLRNALNANGSAPIYACRAWVNFNGVHNTIVGSGNVSSITDNGTGDYTINFTTAMQDANYAISGNATQNEGSSSSSANTLSLKNATNGVLANKSTTSFTIVTVDNSSDAYFDSNNVSVAVFR